MGRSCVSWAVVVGLDPGGMDLVRQIGDGGRQPTFDDEVANRGHEVRYPTIVGGNGCK